MSRGEILWRTNTKFQRESVAPWQCSPAMHKVQSSAEGRYDLKKKRKEGGEEGAGRADWKHSMELEMSFIDLLRFSLSHALSCFLMYLCSWDLGNIKKIPAGVHTTKLIWK